ncbi:MAG: manganese catalase family protein [Clostridia bacterium]|nr:manganese catalase family protein [Clostridia bacterium]
MWGYEKKLQYPVNIKNPDPKMAKFIISQYGGPDGELAASLRYLSQRFSMPTEITKATLNDIGTEELGHLEMVGALVHQLTKGVSPEVLKREGLGAYYTDHGISVYPQAAAGFPFTASVLQVKGDPITDLTEDLAAEQKARSTYEYLIDLADDPDVIDVLRFLREREVVHFQRFGEALRTVQEKLAEKKYYMNNMQGVLGTMNNNMPCGCDDKKKNDCGCDNKKNNDCGCDRR